MVELRLVIGYQGKTKQIKLDDAQAKKLHGLKIGSKVKGDDFGLPGYELEITGGTDKDGFPMRKDLQGTARKKLLLASGPGYKPKEKGVRKRKMIRGNTVAEDIAQLNMKVLKEGSKKWDELFKNEEQSQ